MSVRRSSACNGRLRHDEAEIRTPVGGESKLERRSGGRSGRRRRREAARDGLRFEDRKVLLRLGAWGVVSRDALVERVDNVVEWRHEDGRRERRGRQDAGLAGERENEVDERRAGEPVEITPKPHQGLVERRMRGEGGSCKVKPGVERGARRGRQRRGRLDRRVAVRFAHAFRDG